VCQISTLLISLVAVARSPEGRLGFSLFGGAEQDTLPVVCLSATHKLTVAPGSPMLIEGDQLLAVADVLVGLRVPSLCEAL
jgi:hypothetical protein